MPARIYDIEFTVQVQVYAGQFSTKIAQSLGRKLTSSASGRVTRRYSPAPDSVPPRRKTFDSKVSKLEYDDCIALRKTHKTAT